MGDKISHLGAGTVIHLYIARLLIAIFISVTGILSFLACLAYSIRILNLVVDLGANFSDFFKMLSLMMPTMLYYIIPLSFLISVIALIARMRHDRELTILRSVGLSSARIMQPILFVAVILTIISYLNAFYLMPISYERFKESHYFISDKYATIMLQENTFNFTAKGKVAFYLQKRGDNEELFGVFISDTRQHNHHKLISAPYGRFMLRKNSMLFELNNGVLQDKNLITGKVSMLSFSQYQFDLREGMNESGSRHKGVGEMTLSQIVSEIATSEDGYKRSLYAAIHQRATWPFLSISLTMMACAMLLTQAYFRTFQVLIYVKCFCWYCPFLIISIWLSNSLAGNLWFAVPLYGVVSAPLLWGYRRLQQE